ncbi:hypothetical protein ARC20_11635 [Stenotrophomonas panacihumi]|uniref:Uncharacterized protein n=1 Tax=Stenotrophomonas panacihumi TaxID=676599 RepID=A0A0R0AG93_9GAMM|nr:hypothetical protein ARC20_11635 [Stenotrophomonas panacihumi]
MDFSPTASEVSPVALEPLPSAVERIPLASLAGPIDTLFMPLALASASEELARKYLIPAPLLMLLIAVVFPPTRPSISPRASPTLLNFLPPTL